MRDRTAPDAETRDRNRTPDGARRSGYVNRSRHERVPARGGSASRPVVFRSR